MIQSHINFFRVSRDQFWNRLARELRATCARSAEELADHLEVNGVTPFRWDDDLSSACAKIVQQNKVWIQICFETCSRHGIEVFVDKDGVIEAYADGWPSERFWADSDMDYYVDSDEESMELRGNRRAARFLSGLVLTDEEVSARKSAAEATRAKEA